MTRRRMSAALLALGSLVLINVFIEYRAQPIRMCPGSYDFVCSLRNEIVPLGRVDIDPAPGSLLARYGGKTVGERGLFAREPFPPVATVIGGMLLPLLMLISAAVLILRPAKRTSEQTRK